MQDAFLRSEKHHSSSRARLWSIATPALSEKLHQSTSPLVAKDISQSPGASIESASSSGGSVDTDGSVELPLCSQKRQAESH